MDKQRSLILVLAVIVGFGLFFATVNAGAAGQVEEGHVSSTVGDGAETWSDNGNMRPVSSAGSWTEAVAGGGGAVLFEDFEGPFPPAGWTITETAGTGNNWARNDTITATNRATNFGSGLSAAADPDAVDNGLAWDAELWSPAVVLPPSSTLSFASNFQDFAGNGEAWVYISNDGGVSWDMIFNISTDEAGGTTGGGVLNEIDLDAYSGDTVILRWRYQAANTTAWFWHIDNVTVAPPTPDFINSTKTAAGQAGVNDVITYTIELVNSGEADSVGTVLTDVIPAGTTYISGSLACSSGACSYSDVDDMLSWTGGVSTTGAVEIQFAVEAGPSCADVVQNTAYVTDPLAPAVTLNAATEIVNEVLFTEDFEDDDGGLVAAPDSEWAWGVPTYPVGISAFSGQNVWATDLNGDADDTIGNHVLTWTVTLPDNPAGLFMSWWDWYGDEASDERRIFVDGTEVWNDSGGADQPFWQNHAVDLSIWAGMTVDIVFDLEVCCAGAGPDGWYIDDIQFYAPCGPVIEVAPAALDSVQAQDTVVTQTVTITNSGGVTLDWSINEASELNGPTTVLYDNGPLVNSPGTGVGGADESVLQTTSLGMNLLGAGGQLAANNYVVEEFVVSDPGGWSVDLLTVYAYQTNGISATSSISDVVYQIWDGPPNIAGSNVVTGDLTTDRLVDTYWSNIYRVTESTTGVATDRPIMVAELQAGFYLPPGEYWLQYAAAGGLTSGPWFPPVTINGETTTGNAFQLIAGTDWAFTLDTGTFTAQGLPFLIEGTGSGVCDPGDLPWASLSAGGGAIGPGGSATIDVTFDTTGLPVGTYSGTLCVTSNSVVDSVIAIPLTVQVPGGYLPIIARQ